MPRWIVRPRNIGSTPRALARHLNCETRKYPSARNIRRGFDWTRDFFLIYPDPQHVRFTRFGATDDGYGADEYQRCYRFFSQHKAGQRLLLRQAGLPVPATTTSKDVASHWLVQRNETTGRFEPHAPSSFIVRPLRHAGGQGFRLTSNPADFIQGEEYVQRLYPKHREYRLVYSRGTLLIKLRKKVQEGTRSDQPWNHAVGATFKTVQTCKLDNTTCYGLLANNPIILAAHLVAVDVLWSPAGYVICEFNSCPGLTIENNLLRIVQHVQAAEVVH